jgi:hypothetical protein
MGLGWQGGGFSVSGRKAFFLKKRSTGLYFSASPTIEAMAWIYPRAPETRVFWFFSSAKNILYQSA